MRFSIDTNVLFYAFEAETKRSIVADRLLRSAIVADCVLTNQVLGEFLNVTRKRMPSRMAEARAAISAWALLFPVAATDTTHLTEGSQIAERHRLQFWDSVIIIVAKSAGAEWLFTEDMQDGATIDGVRLINPFKSDNAEVMDLLDTPPPGTA